MSAALLICQRHLLLNLQHFLSCNAFNASPPKGVISCFTFGFLATQLDPASAGSYVTVGIYTVSGPLRCGSEQQVCLAVCGSCQERTSYFIDASAIALVLKSGYETISYSTA